MDRSSEPAPQHPFDAETWRRMVELVNFLRLHEVSPEAQERVARGIVNLRLSHLRESGGRRLCCRGTLQVGYPEQSSPP